MEDLNFGGSSSNVLDDNTKKEEKIEIDENTNPFDNMGNNQKEGTFYCKQN